MPIVVDYTDLAALGQLAQATGRAQRRQRVAEQQTQLQLAQQQMRNQAQIAADREATRRMDIRAGQDTAARELEIRALMNERRLQAEMEELQTRAAMQERERAQQAEQAREEAMMRRERELEVQRLRNAGALERTEAAGAASLERTEAAGQAALDRTIVREELRNQRAPGSRFPQDRAAYRPVGGQTREFAEAEARRYAHILPVRPNAAAPGFARTSERAFEQAEALSRLPTPSLQEWASRNVEDPYFPYVQAILAEREQARRQIRSGTAQGVGTVGAPPAPPAGTAGGAAPGNQSLFQQDAGGVSTGLEGYSDAELMQMLGIDPAANPDQLMQQFFGVGD